VAIERGRRRFQRLALVFTGEECRGRPRGKGATCTPGWWTVRVQLLTCALPGLRRCVRAVALAWHTREGHSRRAKSGILTYFQPDSFVRPRHNGDPSPRSSGDLGCQGKCRAAGNGDEKGDKQGAHSFLLPRNLEPGNEFWSHTHKDTIQKKNWHGSGPEGCFVPLRAGTRWRTFRTQRYSKVLTTTRKVLCCPRAGTRWRTFRTQRYSKARDGSKHQARLPNKAHQQSSNLGTGSPSLVTQPNSVINVSLSLS